MPPLGQVLARLEARFHDWFIYRSRFAKWVYDRRNQDEFAGYYVHEEMLADPVRVGAYRQAIDRLVSAQDVVIDLGTGTGVLAFFAARRARLVHAVEHAPILKVAQRLAAAHGLTNLRFHQMNSRALSLDSKADVLVQEQIGGVNPLSENMILNVLDLRDRLLKPGGRIIPNVFEVFVEPVELKPDCAMPFLWEHEFAGVSYGALRLPAEQRPGTGGALRDDQLQTITPDMVVPAPLCDPRPILRFDLETLRPGDLPTQVDYQNTATRAGRIDGLCIFFRAHLGDAPFIDASPFAPRTSWQMVMCRLERRQVLLGDVIRYHLDLDSLTEHRQWRLTFLAPDPAVASG